MSTAYSTITLHRKPGFLYITISKIKSNLKDLEKQINHLHPNEKALFHAFPSKARKQSYLLGRLAAKKAIQQLTNITNPAAIYIAAGVFDFPIVKGIGTENIQVSISHCKNIGIAIAFPEEHPMGIDVEQINPENETVVISQLTAAEIEMTAQSNQKLATAIFSMKEALSKVIKTGMMLDFQFLEIEHLEINGSVLKARFKHFRQYKAIACIKEDLVYALALPERTTLEVNEFLKVLE